MNSLHFLLATGPMTDSLEKSAFRLELVRSAVRPIEHDGQTIHDGLNRNLKH
jgi:hypothetical protein